jgi:CO/xanthine dehydrogenase Mo-binding subunit
MATALPDPARRRLLAATAAGAGSLVIRFRVEARSAAAPASAARGATEAAQAAPAARLAPNATVAVHADGSVHVRTTKTEMGQGIVTGIAMLVADELDADWSRVQVSTLVPDGRQFMITGGSTSLAGAWAPARKAGAQAREMLRSAAAAAWGVEPAACRTASGRVIHDASGRSLGYGELAARAATLPVPEQPVLKPAGPRPLIGRPLPAKNLEAIVRGQAEYGIDVRVPGMLFASIERSPRINGRVASFDAKAARRVPGVVDVLHLRGNTFPDGQLYVRDGVAVVATSTWAAMQGRAQLQIRWNDEGNDRKPRAGRLASSTQLSADFAAALAEGPGAAADAPHLGLHPWVSTLREGDPAALARAFETAHRTLDLSWELPLLAHAPMEPMNALAHWTPERCEVWTGSHFQSKVLSQLRLLTGLPADRVVVHTPLLGGSFGRRLEPDYAIEAVQLSRELRRPVQVLWTREDDLRCGLFGPPSRHRVRAALAPDGRITALEHSVAALSVRLQSERVSLGPGGLDKTVTIDGEKILPYLDADPRARRLHVRHRLVEQTIRVLWWRRGYTPNHTLVNETLLDEAAHALGLDPLAYRQQLLLPAREVTIDNEGDLERIDTGRLARVQRLAAEAAGWGRALPPGHGRGLASTVTETYVAQVVEVAPAAGGGLRVARVVTAVDCGFVVNPQLVKAQVEGSVVFALTAALKPAITVEQGVVQQGNFNDAPLLRIDEMPAIETVLVNGPEAPTGIGEPASHPTAAALANAVFAATGRRLRSLPFQLS